MWMALPSITHRDTACFEKCLKSCCHMAAVVISPFTKVVVNRIHANRIRIRVMWVDIFGIRMLTEVLDMQELFNQSIQSRITRSLGHTKVTLPFAIVQLLYHRELCVTVLG